jgi:membrane dipeptidase
MTYGQTIAPARRNYTPSLAEAASGVIVDAHNDLLLELAYRAHRRGEPDPFGAHWLAQLESGGVALQVCPAYPDRERMPEGTLREVLGQVAAFLQAVRDHTGRVIAVRSTLDLARVESGERLGLLLALEGAEPIGQDLWMLDLLWELGLRMVGLTWNRRNQFADGAGEPDGGGLSTLGRELVARCAELGIVVDLAHASERTFWDVLEHPAEPAVVVSHAACRALHDHPRNLGDDQLVAVGARGGVLGLMLHPVALGAQATIEHAVDQVDHAVETMGAAHVGLGGDFTRQVVRALGYDSTADALLPDGMALDAAVDGLAGPGDYPRLVGALEGRGYEGDRLAGILGGNFLRLFRSVLPGDPSP